MTSICRCFPASVLGSALWLGMTAAQATTFTVTNLDNDGAGSLRQAIADANEQPGADTIEFEDGLSGTLAIVGTLTLNGVLEILGPGADVITILGNQSDIFVVAADGVVTLSGLAITNGAYGIQNNGDLTVEDCLISKNFSTGIRNDRSESYLSVKDTIVSENDNDGIYNYEGTVVINSSTFSGNLESGIEALRGIIEVYDSIISGNLAGGFYSSGIGSFTIERTSIVGNANDSNGGGFYSNGATSLTIRNSTFSGNEAEGSRCGGAIYIHGTTDIDFYNNTLSGNTAKLGGGLCTDGATILNVFDSTIAYNTATSMGGGITISSGSTLMMGNTLVSGNVAASSDTNGMEVYNDGTFSSRGYNLFGQNGTSGLLDADLAATDMVLDGSVETAIGTLANNGGPTQTHIAAADSPILDAGDNSLVPADATTDQRGEERIQNSMVDIGAVEGTNPRDALGWRVTEIYIATLGFAPDNEGLQYWVDQMTVDPSWTPTTVAQSFFDQPAVQALYPIDDDSALIDALYQNLFAREADAAGRAYWLDELSAARVERNQMVIAMIEGGYANREAIEDMARFSNQVQIGLAFAAEQERLGILYSALTAEQQSSLRAIGTDLMEQATAEDGMRDRLIAQIPGLLAELAP